MMTMTTTKTAAAVRYYVSPKPTVRGWYVLSVVLVDGKEVTGSYKAEFANKTQAHAHKAKMNAALAN
jgi:hypothetical protein